MAICSVVTCLGTIFGTYVTLKTSQAVMNTRLDELTREVRLHNNFASRVPLIEQEIEHIKEELNYVRETKEN